MSNIIRPLTDIEREKAVASYQKFMRPIIEAAAKQKMMLPVKYVLHDDGSLERVVSEKELEIQKEVEALSEYGLRQCGLM